MTTFKQLYLSQDLFYIDVCYSITTLVLQFTSVSTLYGFRLPSLLYIRVLVVSSFDYVSFVLHRRSCMLFDSSFLCLPLLKWDRISVIRDTTNSPFNSWAYGKGRTGRTRTPLVVRLFSDLYASEQNSPVCPCLSCPIIVLFLFICATLNKLWIQTNHITSPTNWCDIPLPKIQYHPHHKDTWYPPRPRHVHATSSKNSSDIISIS